jgi:hypothetical protein
MIEFRAGAYLPILSGKGIRLLWPFILSLAVFLPALFLFLPIRAPDAIALLGFLFFLPVLRLVECPVFRQALRGPPSAR